MTPWQGPPPPVVPQKGAGDWLRILWRGTALGIVTFGCLLLLLVVRLIERPIFGWHRPVTPFITQFVCRMAFVILGIRHIVRGRQMRERGAVVANHGSWLDIFTLNARKRIYFVSKAEVADWPGIGWLARSTGTLFINRDRRDARAHNGLFEERLKANHKLLFFPEGTTTDGLRVLPFKTTLFAAFFADDLRYILHIQPVTVVYTAPRGQHPAFYGWWGDMGFGEHLLKVLAAKRQGSVEVIYHPPLRVADFADRKALAKACEESVRSGLSA
ncbi:lyso-ornithine lipid acyltransferase [Rhodovulum bhavnagarense]|uniref:Lyso-ornithine lipid acyltransferase n=1 Tax=Rhodovulum bhavnagarense TaxID=992286 RepID=A0A4R2RB42_9RHOB|nr:lysophospholipid acyltransferase family protein [Rhodovulum bhavnagarense]TCP60530.1 lyso-ornithine lipid acyltransferase [Rhodovulum bhavnagarense]